MALLLSLVDQLYPSKAMAYPSESRPFFDRISSWLLDTVARLFSLPVPDNVNQQVVVSMSFYSFSLSHISNLRHLIRWS
jgi:hypothetical protein